MGLHYYDGDADPETLRKLAESTPPDYDPPEEIQALCDVAEEHGYVIKGVLLEDAP